MDSSSTNATTYIEEAGATSNIESYKEGMEEYDSGKEWTIYRIPRNMFQISENSYIPKLVSIGPIHHGKIAYKAMEEHKKRYLLRLLGYSTQLANISSPREFLSQQAGKIDSLEQEMMRIEKKTRKCYSEAVNMDKKMMVMDGCFVIELLRLHYKYLNNSKDVDDPIFTTRWMLCTLRRDLLMLENQLPYKVLKVIYKFTGDSSRQDKVPLNELVVQFFNPLLRRTDAENSLHLHQNHNFVHMLDVFRTSFHPHCPGNHDEDRMTNDSLLNHSATELREAGVRFNSVTLKDLFTIDFNPSTGILNIPPFQIEDNTVLLFLNFIAYEQCHRAAEPYFTNFFMFLDRLVNTANDIEILHNKDIINHALGSDKDVASLINRLSREIIYDADTCHLRKHMTELNNYCDDGSNKLYVWFLALKRDYFKSPWTVASLIGAILLLVLTICQTILAFCTYF
ncbi:hypothetical protein MKX03_027330 [Papaver bracteatum]|nr:hypothetical protein MKX03_027330 [Papaver bracteatum]